MIDTFGQRLRLLRKKAALNQEQLAEAVGVHLNTISRWENDLSGGPNAQQISSLCDALGCSEAELLNDSNNFGSRLKDIRKSKGLTQEELADLSGFSIMTVRRWEWGERTPRIEEIKRIAHALNVQENELLNEPLQERWVLQIKLADDRREEFIDMTKDMPCVAAITGNPYGADLHLSGSWDTFSDDEKFMDFIDQIMNSRDALLQLKKSMSPIWKGRGA